MVTIFNRLNRKQADSFSLVLSAAGIGNRVIDDADGFRIDVPEPHVSGALEAIYRYQAENQPTENELTARSVVSTHKNLSGIAIALVLLSIHWAILASSVPQDYYDVFGANARRIQEGEVYRCVTALLVHADAAHVAGNMVGVVLFGSAVCTITGSGVGWLMMLACGLLGNLMNAFSYETGHLSIGASTAVFSGVGILCALQAVNALRTGKGWKRMVVVLGAGMALLAVLGTSARSDVGAHLYGFFCGGLMGSVYGLWTVNPLGRTGQVLCGLIAVSILILSWIKGAYSG